MSMASVLIRRRKGSLVYQLRIRLPNGERIERTLGTRDRKIALEAKREAERRLALGIDPLARSATGRLTFTEYSEFWLHKVDRRLRRGTTQNYHRAVREVLPLLGHLPMPEVTREHANRAAELLASKRGRGRRTTLGLLAALQSMFGAAAEDLRDERGESVLLRNPFRQRTRLVADLFPNSAGDSLGPDSEAWIERNPEPYGVEAQRTLRVLDLDLSDRCKIALGDGSGLRIGEVFGLHWTDLNLDTGLGTARRAVDAYGEPGSLKTKRSRRTFPLNSTTTALLRRLRAAQGAIAGPVFPARTGQGRYEDRRKFGMRMKAAMTASGIEVRRHFFHRLRHSFCSRLLQNGVEPWKVSRWAGHKNVEFTQDVYAAYIPDDAHIEEVDRGL